MAQRLTYRRRHSYNTKSNAQKVVRTPGGKLVFQQVKKLGKRPSCPVSGQLLNGVAAVRPKELAHVARHKRSVSRVYGGHLAAKVVRERIVRAFLVEEQKIVKKVLKLQQAKEATAAKAAKKSSKKK